MSCEIECVFVPEMTYREVWTFPVTGPAGQHSAPENVLDVCLTVGRDLQCRWDGPDTYTQNCVGTVSLVDTGYFHVALSPGRRPRPQHKSAGTSPLRGFSFGGSHIEQPTQELTVMIAGEIQDQLVGGMPLVLWPLDEQRLLIRAVWVACSSDRVVAGDRRALLDMSYAMWAHRITCACQLHLHRCTSTYTFAATIRT